MRLLMAAALVLTTLDASAQPIETVTVVGSNSFVGVWKLSVPGVGAPTQPPRVRSALDVYCRIEKENNDFYTRCFVFIEGDVRVKDKHIRITWGPTLVRWSIDADLQSDTYFSGTVSDRVLVFGGETYPGVVTGTKLSLSEQLPDVGGKSSLVKTILEQIEQGRLDLPHDLKAIGQNGGQFNGGHFNSDDPLITAKELHPLGTVQSVNYLGTELNKDIAAPVLFAVYDVEFENGHRLCGIHQRDDGVIDGFRCV